MRFQDEGQFDMMNTSQELFLIRECFMDFTLYQNGHAFDVYRFFGAHPSNKGTVFRTHAPYAQRVTLIGDFSNWEELEMDVENGVWSLYVDQARPGMKYKFRIHGADNSIRDHADPYAFYSELRPRTASVIYDHAQYKFNDNKWMETRSRNFNAPVSIYEMHLGSWKTKVHELGEHLDGVEIHEEEDNWFSYKEIAKPLAEYLENMGYTHVEFLPLLEHPLDMSWGYQPSGFFSATSRYGNPDELKYLIDTLHQHNIGVILDFVPVHFVTNDYALGNYDGTAFYEYPHPDIGYSEWGSYNFMHSSGEVRSFLSSAAAYWLDYFHIDGLRFDAVSRLIYWQGDENRGYIHHAIEFMKGLNAGIHRFFPDVMLIAEDSTDYPLVTKSTQEGGLDFDYKWDMGWMHDTLKFFQTPPWERTHAYNRISFSMMYFYNENYVLPFSHDEVVHGKATITQKMHGDYHDKFPQSRALYMYMFAHPGKKLNFMGNEIAQLREWDEKREQDWDMLAYETHRTHQHYFRDLNHFYKNTPQLYKDDFNPAGYKWLIVEDSLGVVYAFWRGVGKEKIFFIFNFSGQSHDYYAFSLDGAHIVQELMNSDWEEYGGNTYRPSADTKTWTETEDERYAIRLTPFNSRAFLVVLDDTDNVEKELESQ